MTNLAVAPTLNTWNHICVVSTASASTLYVDSVLRTTGAALTPGTLTRRLW